MAKTEKKPVKGGTVEKVRAQPGARLAPPVVELNMAESAGIRHGAELINAQELKLRDMRSALVRVYGAVLKSRGYDIEAPLQVVPNADFTQLMVSEAPVSLLK